MKRRDFLAGAFATTTVLPYLAAGQTANVQSSFDRGTVTGSGLKFRFVCPALREKVHIYVIGDTHIGDDDERGKPFEQYSARMAAAYNKFDRHANLAKAVKQATEKKIDFVALVGDIISYPSHTGTEYIRETMDGGGVPWAYVSGNHDWHYEGEKGPQTELRARWAEKRLKPLYQGENPLMFAKVVKGLKVDPAACRAAFTPGVFATDVALRKVAKGTPWRDAYHDVRDHLGQLDSENPDAAAAIKKHEGTCLGLDHDLYRARIAAAYKSADARRRELDANCRRLLK